MVKIVCLMPLFNHVDTLRRSVQSVLKQIGIFDLKLVILDDCSTDGSYELALELQKTFPSQIIVHKNDHNVRLLLSIYNGYNYLIGSDYFCVLDPDDWYTDDKKLSTAVTFLESHKDYSLYMNNVLVKKGKEEDVMVKTTLDYADFSYEDLKAGKFAPFVQTSGVVYRNCYFKDKFNDDFKKIFNYSFSESFRADSFRFYWYLKNGRAYFNNKTCSIYNYDSEGIWARLDFVSQIITNAKLFFAMSEFFTDKEYYEKQSLLKLMTLQKNKCSLDTITYKEKAELKKLLLLLDIHKKNIVLREITSLYILICKIFSKFLFGNIRMKFKDYITQMRNNNKLAIYMRSIFTK